MAAKLKKYMQGCGIDLFKEKREDGKYLNRDEANCYFICIMNATF
jgi:hypothetical protein